MDHPSLVELAAVCEGGLPPHREKEVVHHLLFQRCEHCLAAAPESLRVLVGLEPARRLPTPEEEVAYDTAIDRAATVALEHVRHQNERRLKTDRGLKALEAGRRLPRSLDPLSRIRTLLQRSWQLRHEDLREMVRLARAAAKVAMRLNPKLYGVDKIHDCQAETLAELGNAYRAANQPQEAEKALERARELFEQGTRQPLLEIRLLELEACLLADLRQYGPASHKLLQVLRFYSRFGDRQRVGRTLAV